MTPSFRLLAKRRFLPLFVTQFLGAFNDNALKYAMLFLVNFTLYAADPNRSAMLAAIATGDLPGLSARARGAKADGRAALMYAHRITGRRGQTLGVLVLRFRFANEMTLIFDAMCDARREVAIVLMEVRWRLRELDREMRSRVAMKAPGELPLLERYLQEVQRRVGEVVVPPEPPVASASP